MRHTRPRLRTRLGLSLALGVSSGFTLLTLSAGTTWADDCADPTTCDTPVSTTVPDGTAASQDTSTTPAPADADSSAAPAPAVDNDTTDTDATVQTTTDSAAQSGDAAVVNNATAGDATSGDGAVDVTQTNLVDTNSGLDTPATFDVDLTQADADPNGNYIINLSSLLPPGTGNGTQPDAVLSSTTTDASIANTITATAASGNAVVAGNGDAGNATSGNASVVVNLINVINSSVAAGQSFVGTINVYGNFTGNILIPQSVIDQLLATNSGAGSDPSSVSTDTNESIVNNVNTTATSGDATVAHNSGNYGTATTGDAATNMTILNLTGSSVVGQNVLLVFVNVMGHWVGMLVNAPAGATSGEYAGGVSTATPSTGYSGVSNDASLSIVNNVNATATSGNAVVARNQNAGNATSGDASVAVNILNMEDSVLSLANWFGILFINVFGTWTGSFGFYTPPAPAAPNASVTTDGIATEAFAAVHHLPGHFATATSYDSTDPEPATGVLGDATSSPATVAPQKLAALPTPDNGHTNYALPLIGLGMSLLILLAAERDKVLHRSK